MADENNGEIPTVAKFLQWADERCEHGERAVLYRGLASADWEVEAGSYRRLRKSIARKNPRGNSQEDVLQALFAEDNKRLLQKMRMEKYWEGSDLEILAKLQHDGAATCLIDFTIQPLIALWFACQPSPDENKSDKTVSVDGKKESSSGKVVAIDRENYTPVTPEDMKEKKKEIWNFLFPENQQPKLWIWEPPGQNNNRIIAQHSVFVFGPPKISIGENDSCIVEEKNKKDILEELKNIGISAESIFRDYAGFILLNKHDEIYENWPIDGSFYSGLMNQEIGEYEQAIKCYNQVIDVESKNPVAYYNRGNAKRDLKHYKEAMADYDEAIRLDSKYSWAYNNRGHVNSILGNYKEEMADYDEAIRFDSKNAMAYHNRCLGKIKIGDMEGSSADYWEAKKLAPDDERLVMPEKLKEYLKSKKGE